MFATSLQTARGMPLAMRDHWQVNCNRQARALKRKHAREEGKPTLANPSLQPPLTQTHPTNARICSELWSACVREGGTRRRAAHLVSLLLPGLGHMKVAETPSQGRP